MGLLEELNRFYYRKSLNELKKMSDCESGAYITYNSLLYLNVIMWTKNCTAGYISKALNVSKSAVAVKINELLKQGLIERCQSKTDKRIYYITIKPETADDLCKFDRKLEGAIETIGAKYSWSHLESFNVMLQKINEEYEQNKNG
ncbi:MAG: MarR family transcriptional regulator [Eubacterium sp.]|jgi:DNA-binding MarR family transcriptional regulator|nr:MarR family transcriptional regulator [Eubacterium sp.]